MGIVTTRHAICEKCGAMVELLLPIDAEEKELRVLGWQAHDCMFGMTCKVCSGMTSARERQAFEFKE